MIRITNPMIRTISLVVFMLVTMLARRLTIAKNHIAGAIVITMMNAISHSGKDIAERQSKHYNMAERFSHCTANLTIFMPSTQKSNIATIISRLVKYSAVHAPIISVSYRGNTITIPLVGTNLLGNGQKQHNEQVQGRNLLGNREKQQNEQVQGPNLLGNREKQQDEQVEGPNLLGNREKQQNEQVQGANLLGNGEKMKNYRLSMRREFGRRLFTRLPIFFTNPNPLPR